MQIDDLIGARIEYASERYHHLPKGSHLIVLEGEISTLLTLPVCDLHKVSAHQRLADVGEVPSLVLVRLGYNVDFEALHDSKKLGADIFCLRKGTSRDIVVPGPIAFV